MDIERAIAALKRNWVSYAGAEDFEIKGRHIRQGLEFFKNMSWERREEIIRQVADRLYDLPCRIFSDFLLSMPDCSLLISQPICSTAILTAEPKPAEIRSFANHT